MNLNLLKKTCYNFVDLFSDLLQNIYANNVKIDSTDAISSGQCALPKVTALMSESNHKRLASPRFFPLN